jgi:hypothetical protein
MPMLPTQLARRRALANLYGPFERWGTREATFFASTSWKKIVSVIASIIFSAVLRSCSTGLYPLCIAGMTRFQNVLDRSPLKFCYKAFFKKLI